MCRQGNTTRLYVTTKPDDIDSPAVRYRGIFINDEDWGLHQWARNTFEPESRNIGPKTYEKVFELMLRLPTELHLAGHARVHASSISCQRTSSWPIDMPSWPERRTASRCCSTTRSGMKASAASGTTRPIAIRSTRPAGA